MQTTDKNVINQVLLLTGLTDEQHNQLVFKTAEEYLTGFSPHYPQVVTQVLKSSIFWNWWRHHWEQRDKEFIEECHDWHTSQQTRLETYYEKHHAPTLLTAVYLSGQVLEESFAAMFGQLTDAQHKQYKQQEVAA
jgi:hypothetical protein